MNDMETDSLVEIKHDKSNKTEHLSTTMDFTIKYKAYTCYQYHDKLD